MPRSVIPVQGAMREQGAPDASAGARSDGDRDLLGMLAVGLAMLYLPAVWDLSRGPWSSELQGHELVMLVASLWLLYQQREALRQLPNASSSTPGNLLMAVGLLVYFYGRTQQILSYELLSLTVLLAALVLRYKGFAGLRLAWFPLFFQLFARPLPYDFVMTVTAPLKASVSAVAAWLLSAIGYPVARSGVVMTIGQYKLLINEACAGLQTIFTLEAMGLLYANLMHHGSVLRNALLAVLVVPVSFAANVIRVMVLAAITFHYGDAAGQGFLHDFAGILLFLVALIFITAVDRLLGVALAARAGA